VRGPVDPTPSVLRPLHDVRLLPGGLLGDWQNRNGRATLPHCIRQLEASGALSNLRREKDSEVPHRGMWFSDSDVYKTLEAAAWHLGRHPDDAAVQAFFTATVELLEQAQAPDGYLNSYFQHDHPDRQWRELTTSHELYCAGHLIQAAVAATRAGLGDRLLAVARRFADLLVVRFGPAGEVAVCGHPEIETALVELYRLTAHRPYLELARLFIDRRGHGLLAPGAFGAAYHQDHRPVREAPEFTGHAVRQLYLLAGVVDVAVETGDASLLEASRRLWRSAFTSKTYLTGGHGSRHRDEAIGDPYELPPDRAYAESCAAIGSLHWNWRMLLATGEGRYAEEIERVLYNAVAVAVAEDGTHFFYSNPLQLRTGHDDGGEDAPAQRLSWYSCACCPPNLARLMASLHAYLATSDDGGVQLHQYTRSTLHHDRGDLAVDTEFPWDGTVSVTVESTSDDEWTLALRVPAWCTDATLLIGDTPVATPDVDGYRRVTRVWKGRTTVTLRLAMPPRYVNAHPRVDAVRGCVAPMRGPLVYCIEQADLAPGTILEDVRVDPSAAIEVAGQNLMVATDVVAVPYFRWGNRQPGPMRVWIPFM
jgi:uncharacterized protein